MKARAVLEDCRAAVSAASAIDNAAAWRPAWVALLSHLRMVGAVLWTEDRPSSTSLKLVVPIRFERWNMPRVWPVIWWDFIRRERDLALLEYRARPSNARSPFLMLSDTASWKGRACVDVARDAIAWWEVELDAIAEAARVDAESRKAHVGPNQQMSPYKV